MTGAGASEVAGLAAAAQALRAGGVVAFPTETVYGLGADAGNSEAVARVYALKGRPRSHPLIVHIASAADLPRWAREIPAAAQALAARYWPGPLTLVLPRAVGVSDAVTGGQDTVALRVPAHPVARALLAAFGRAIAAPSANRYGHVSPTRASHGREEFGGDVPAVLDGGDCEVGLESTIVACLEGRVTLLRPGTITLSDLAAVVGEVQAAAVGAAPRTPGSTPAHYAPRTPLTLLPASELAAAAIEQVAGGERVGVLALAPRPGAPLAGLHWVDAGTDPLRYGHDLYAHLRDLDHAECARLLVQMLPPGEAWDAPRDRLQRAAASFSGLALAGIATVTDGDLP
jgi:L-threonylcarbamoyladenylate synthase